MQPLVMYEQGKAIKEAYLFVLEQLLECSLPDDYKEFLRKYNGGSPEPSDFLYWESKTELRTARIQYFYAIDNRFTNIIRRNEIDKERIPSELISIADDPFGNKICLSVRGENQEKVYLWHHELAPDDIPAFSYEGVFLIAESFSHLIDSLVEIEYKD